MDGARGVGWGGGGGGGGGGNHGQDINVPCGCKRILHSFK